MGEKLSEIMKNDTKLFVNTTQSGFTLIELIIVIVILGILSVVAAPRFIDIQSDAQGAVLEGVSAALSGANQLVFAKAILQDQEDLEEGSVDLGNSESVATRYGYIAFTDNVYSGASLSSILNIDLCHHLNGDDSCASDGSTQFIYDIDTISGVNLVRIFPGSLADSDRGPDNDQIECRLDYRMPINSDDSPSYEVFANEC